MQPRRRILIRFCILAIGVIFLASLMTIVLIFPPTRTGFYPPCLFHRVTGWHCAGCGCTRAAYSLMTGDPSQAFAYNAIFTLLVPGIAMLVVRKIWYWLWDRDDSRQFMSAWVMMTLAVVLILFSIARNIPVEPFTLLAPHQLQRSP